MQLDSSKEQFRPHFSVSYRQPFPRASTGLAYKDSDKAIHFRRM